MSIEKPKSPHVAIPSHQEQSEARPKPGRKTFTFHPTRFRTFANYITRPTIEAGIVSPACQHRIRLIRFEKVPMEFLKVDEGAMRGLHVPLCVRHPPVTRETIHTKRTYVLYFVSVSRPLLVLVSYHASRESDGLSLRALFEEVKVEWAISSPSPFSSSNTAHYDEAMTFPLSIQGHRSPRRRIPATNYHEPSSSHRTMIQCRLITNDSSTVQWFWD